MPASEADLVLVLCASGKQASALLPSLSTAFRRLRLACHSDASASRLRSQYPNAEVVQPDLTTPSACVGLLHGVAVVFHIGPPFHPQETVIGINMINAASSPVHATTFKHFVYSSVLHSCLRKLINHDNKRPVEEYLIESTLHYTILQPSHLLNTGVVKQLAAQKGSEAVLKWNFNVDTQFSFLALPDLAAVAVKVIREREAHYYAIYPLCSTGPQNYRDVAATVGRVLGKTVRVEQRPFEEAIEAFLGMVGAKDQDTNSPVRIAAERLLLYYNHRGLVCHPGVTEWLLGHKATTWEDIARDSMLSEHSA